MANLRPVICTPPRMIVLRYRYEGPAERIALRFSGAKNFATGGKPWSYLRQYLIVELVLCDLTSMRA